MGKLIKRLIRRITNCPQGYVTTELEEEDEIEIGDLTCPNCGRVEEECECD